MIDQLIDEQVEEMLQSTLRVGDRSSCLKCGNEFTVKRENLRVCSHCNWKIIHNRDVNRSRKRRSLDNI